jgi:hypothetical protein
MDELPVDKTFFCSIKSVVNDVCTDVTIFVGLTIFTELFWSKNVLFEYSENFIFYLKFNCVTRIKILTVHNSEEPWEFRFVIVVQLPLKNRCSQSGILLKRRCIRFVINNILMDKLLIRSFGYQCTIDTVGPNLRINQLCWFCPRSPRRTDHGDHSVCVHVPTRLSVLQLNQFELWTEILSEMTKKERISIVILLGEGSRALQPGYRQSRNIEDTGLHFVVRIKLPCVK